MSLLLALINGIDTRVRNPFALCQWNGRTNPLQKSLIDTVRRAGEKHLLLQREELRSIVLALGSGASHMPSDSPPAHVVFALGCVVFTAENAVFVTADAGGGGTPAGFERQLWASAAAGHLDARALYDFRGGVRRRGFDGALGFIQRFTESEASCASATRCWLRQFWHPTAIKWSDVTSVLADAVEVVVPFAGGLGSPTLSDTASARAVASAALAINLGDPPSPTPAPPLEAMPAPTAPSSANHSPTASVPPTSTSTSAPVTVPAQAQAPKASTAPPAPAAAQAPKATAAPPAAAKRPRAVTEIDDNGVLMIGGEGETTVGNAGGAGGVHGAGAGVNAAAVTLRAAIAAQHRAETAAGASKTDLAALRLNFAKVMQDNAEMRCNIESIRSTNAALRKNADDSLAKMLSAMSEADTLRRATGGGGGGGGGGGQQLLLL